jgi:hypothetical protein
MTDQLEQFDPANVALGKKLGVVEDPRTFKFRTFMPMHLPVVGRDWRMARNTRTVPMFDNDRIGCCTIASQAHGAIAHEISTSQSDIRKVPITDEDVRIGYSAISGYDPRTGRNDNGAYMLDALNYRRRVGIGREPDGSPHKIAGFVKVDHNKPEELRVACAIFGGLYLGIWLPNSAVRQTGPNKLWDVPEQGPQGEGEPGSWGGHAVWQVGFTQKDCTIYTWAREQRMTWDFIAAYVDEAYAVISEDWLRSRSQTTHRGFNVQQLQGYLEELAR